MNLCIFFEYHITSGRRNRWHILAARIPREELALEEDLECFPHERRGRFCAVDCVRSIRESGADRLVNVDHWNMKMSRVLRGKFENHVLLLALFQLLHVFRRYSPVMGDSHLYGLRYVEFPSSFTKHGPFSANEHGLSTFPTVHMAVYLERDQSSRNILDHRSTFDMVRSNFTFVLASPVMLLPERERRSVGRIASLEEPEPLSSKHQHQPHLTVPY